MSKQIRDGSATIRKAKMTLVVTTFRQVYRSFIKEPTQGNLEALVESGREYLTAATPVNVSPPADLDS